MNNSYDIVLTMDRRDFTEGAVSTFMQYNSKQMAQRFMDKMHLMLALELGYIPKQ